jgi:uncharacterized phiE125 gp8 family phage protein
VELAYGQAYPVTQYRESAVQIRIVAGYGAAAAVPKALKQAILLYVAEMHARRAQATIGATVVPNVFSAEQLMWPYRLAA